MKSFEKFLKNEGINWMNKDLRFEFLFLFIDDRYIWKVVRKRIYYE